MAAHSNNNTKKNLIETAFLLFRERGYDNVTVNDICDACGITKPTFYYHLSSKEEILSRFYDGVIQDMASRLLDALAEENYWEQLMACFDTLMETAGQIGPELYAQLYIANLREDQGTFDFRDDLTKMAVRLIERAQKAGQIRNSSPPGPLYRAAAHLFEGYELLWCIKKGSFERRRYIRRAMEDIFDTAPAFRSMPLEREDNDYV